MSKIKQLVSEDLELYDNSTDENGMYPGEMSEQQAEDYQVRRYETARDRLIDAVEFDKAQREFELSKYSTSELRKELEGREADNVTR